VARPSWRCVTVTTRGRLSPSSARKAFARITFAMSCSSRCRLPNALSGGALAAGDTFGAPEKGRAPITDLRVMGLKPSTYTLVKNWGRCERLRNRGRVRSLAVGITEPAESAAIFQPKRPATD
jgi:hypothetical protein